MRVLTLCLSPDLGGLELYAYRSARALAMQHEVYAAAGNKLLDYFRNNSTIEVMTKHVTFKPLPLIAARSLAKYIDDRDIDIIYAHWTKDIPLAVLAKLFSRKTPRLVFMRQMQITRSKADFYHNFLYKNIDLMLTITNQLTANCKKFINGLPGSHIKTLYLGVPEPDKKLGAEEIKTIRQQLKLDENDFVVGLFGRLEKNKGQHLLIEALAQAKKESIIIKALIVGHEMLPGYMNSLVELAQSMEVSEQVIFPGFVDNPQEVMQVCDCVALTTSEETFGLVLPEAMRAGVAVIGSNRGGVLEIIEHEKTGLLFESGNSASLYQQLKRLYTNPDLKKQLAINGKNYADTMFNDKKHYQALVEHFNQLLQPTTLATAQ